MRIATFAVLLTAGTALSGCVGNQLDAITNLSAPCSTTTQSINCGAAVTNPVTGGPVVPPVVVPPGPNSGNTSTIVTGDTTLALEGGSVISIPGNMAVSTLTETAGATNSATFAITTNTATNGNWPTPKTMNEYVAGTAVGSGIGGTYKEYRALNRVPGSATAVDEELQVWRWNAGTGSSFGTQYRNVTTGANPAGQNAWSFGGTYTTAAQMPTSTSAVYSGKFTGIAKSSNFVNPVGTAQTLDRNNIWSVTGDTALTANFGTSGTVTGTLTPTAWKAWQTLGGEVGFRTTTDPLAPGAPTGLAGTINAANWAGFMGMPVQINGTIATSTATTGNTHPNTITGVAQYDPNGNWVNVTSNSFFTAGFFGSNADNITGVFSTDAVTLDPIGGTTAINDDRRAFLSMTGIFNACRTGPVC